MIEEQGLTQEEYKKIVKYLGREPNYTELGLFSAMWSEHCSYKNSKSVLKLFPTSGPQVIQGPGENAGVVEIGDGMAVAMKVESHNHPSAIEPFEAAATGGGGVARDIFTMGAEPVGLLYSLRFGRAENKHVQYLLREVGRGFFYYANTAEVPVLGGEISFDASYEKNPLVNAMCVGILQKKNLIRAKASNAGSLVYTIGGAAGRDGIGGAAFASGGIDESKKIDSSAVAIGDPKLGKILRQACLELMEKKCVEGMQDMGAAGLVCSTSEMSYKGGRGMDIDVGLVPRKSARMNPYEVMLSESQERMLLVLNPEREHLALEILEKRKIPAVKIGVVTDDGILRIRQDGKIVAEVPSKILVEAPEYLREIKTPAYIAETMSYNFEEIKEPSDYNQVLLKLLASVNIACQQIVYNQIKPSLRKRILLGPGSEAAAIRLPNSQKAAAWTVKGNGTYCFLNPYRGGAIAVAEAARSLVCSGAKPLAITDGLNFGNPMKAENFWQLRKCVEGISEACRQLNTPVVSGNVSLNNENPHGAIDPTPIIGMAGVIDDYQKTTTPHFKKRGDLIALIGETKNEIGGSEYLKTVYGLKKGDAPEIDWDTEKKGQKFCLTAIQQGLLNSAHGCAEGGLAVALAKCCLNNPKKMLGADIKISDVVFNWGKRTPQMEFKVREPVRSDALLFGESQSRFVVSFAPSALLALQNLAQKLKAAFNPIGKVEGNKLLISRNEKKIINLPLARLKEKWEETFRKLLKKKREKVEGRPKTAKKKRKKVEGSPKTAKKKRKKTKGKKKAKKITRKPKKTTIKKKPQTKRVSRRKKVKTKKTGKKKRAKKRKR